VPPWFIYFDALQKSLNAKNLPQLLRVLALKLTSLTLLEMNRGWPEMKSLSGK